MSENLLLHHFAITSLLSFSFYLCNVQLRSCKINKSVEIDNYANCSSAWFYFFAGVCKAFVYNFIFVMNCCWRKQRKESRLTHANLVNNIKQFTCTTCGDNKRQCACPEYFQCQRVRRSFPFILFFLSRLSLTKLPVTSPILYAASLTCSHFLSLFRSKIYFKAAHYCKHFYY